MNGHRCETKRNAGFTLIEMMIVVTLFTALLATTGVLLTSTTKLAHAEEMNERVDSTARRLGDRIVEELRGASIPTLVPASPDGATEVAFQVGIGFDGDALRLSPVRGIRFTPSTVEGLSGEVALLENGEATLLATNITALRFDAVSGGLSVTISVLENDDDGLPVERTVVRRVSPRN